MTEKEKRIREYFGHTWITPNKEGATEEEKMENFQNNLKKVFDMNGVKR